MEPTRTYRSWTNDGARWNHYRPRDGDIIIATYPKCGTTWVQRIVSLLVFQSPEPLPIFDVSPWIDASFGPPIEAVIEQLEKQQHRRFIKAHLPFDGLPFYEEVRYIHVARDGRDSCMSYFNHCAGYTEKMYEALDRAADDMGGPAPRCPSSVQTFWRDWLTKGIRPESSDGHPTHSFFDFESSYWRARHRSNLLLVHYNDLSADLAGEMRRIADFLEIEVGDELWPELVEAATFGRMKREGAALLPHAEVVFEGGYERFLYKGSNGRWQEEIPADLLGLYEQKVASRFTPGLARWIECGRLESGDPHSAPE